tara:strand:- start:39188 stop:39952 length:765 start_codon:yes stop_codon:yes gene_type:complete
MGLDWCVRDKTIESQEVNLMFADAQLNKLMEERSEDFIAFCKELGEDVPTIYPNPLVDRWEKTPNAINILERTRKWRLAKSVCVVTPMDTLGAPQIGMSKEADEWAREHYKEVASSPGGEALRAKYPTVEDYIMDSQGKYVSELATRKEGMVGPSGICVGPESFRGKVLGYIDWLDEALVSEAWEDHSPEDLLDYGERLLEAAESFEKSILSMPEEILSSQAPSDAMSEVELVKEAANWCKFWGSEGHSMHAWY